ncbi:MAG: type II secretion system F family protein [Pseudomonadales bacterium]
MPIFKFEATDAQGAKSSGRREAASAGQLAQGLQAEGLIPLRIQETSGESKTPETSDVGLSWPFSKPKISFDEVILFSHQMHSLTKAGISVVRAIRGLSDSQKNEQMAIILKEISANLESGADLATSFGRYPETFSELFMSVIHVGENTGRLDSAFRQIASYLEMERETRKRIKSATRYPMFVLGAISIAIVIMNIFVIPAFAGVFEKFNAELPWQTQLLMSVSAFFVNYWWLLLLLIGAGVFAARRYLAAEQGRLRWDEAKLSLPLLGSIFERINLARFCQTFAMVSRSGLPINQSLTVIARVIGNEYLSAKVVKMREGVERGSGILETAKESNMFTPVVLQMIAVGEETGAMDDLLEQAAGFYEEEVDYQLKGLTDAIEPILIVAIAGMVLILALGVFLPLWDLSGVANR